MSNGILWVVEIKEDGQDEWNYYDCATSRKEARGWKKEAKQFNFDSKLRIRKYVREEE